MKAFEIKSIPGPVLVIGASGFIGANILRTMLRERDDVVGTIFSGQSWRLEGIPSYNVSFMNLQDPVSVHSLLGRYSPKTIFDCSSFGAYSFEQEFSRIHATNYISFINIMEILASYEIHAYIHAGSSSEYGTNSAGPSEDGPLVPNSHYAVSKAGVASAIAYYGKTQGLPVVNLRLYSIYGPYEDSSRLIPVLCENILRRSLPPFANPNISRDFVHAGDAVDAFFSAALRMNPRMFGESYNIGTGVETSLGGLARLARDLFGIDADINFDPAETRAWDVEHWFANTEKSEREIGWKYSVPLSEGLRMTCDWWGDFLRHSEFGKLTKKSQPDKIKNSVSAIVACYKDAQAISMMYERLVSVFTRLGLDYEIIFVNDASPDNSEEVIREISAKDPNVMGITHSRNFGSQSAFRSGMEMSGKEACVLLDGDLQDPPELIEDFVRLWREGYDVVYGRRIKREMSVILEMFYKMFYRIFAAMSEFAVPKDAGDFSLIDASVVYWILQCQERDSFLRGLRAYVGFNQTGVDYVRPERMFGRSTNNWIKNIGWAKKAIFSFTRVPLHILTAFGSLTVCLTAGLALWTFLVRIFAPQNAPRGMTFLSLLIMLFGSSIIFGLGLLGEYLGKIFEETKARPPFIRKTVIKHGRAEPSDFSHFPKG
ncbi:MAG: GDP-mannose 4,6-dehydratase [Synergistaceae bacterium]|jgi:dolichol-phosphate mannosyltransferase|nr:GDP-mannose 4,6-dehydratase [Synergistaceae bacterium]